MPRGGLEMMNAEDISLASGLSIPPSLSNVAVSPNLSKGENDLRHSGINGLNMDEII